MAVVAAFRSRQDIVVDPREHNAAIAMAAMSAVPKTRTVVATSPVVQNHPNATDDRKRARLVNVVSTARPVAQCAGGSSRPAIAISTPSVAA